MSKPSAGHCKVSIHRGFGLGVVTDHLAWINAQLESLSVPHSVAFGVWCSGRMLSAFNAALTRRVGGNNVGKLQDVIDALWAYVIGSTKIEKASMEGYRESLLELDWDRGDDDEEQDPEVEIEDIGSEETLEAVIATVDAFRSGKRVGASRAAEALLNKVNAELDFRYGISNSSEHPEMTAEIERQKSFVRRLRSESKITDDMRKLC